MQVTILQTVGHIEMCPVIYAGKWYLAKVCKSQGKSVSGRPTSKQGKFHKVHQVVEHSLNDSPRVEEYLINVHLYLRTLI